MARTMVVTGGHGFLGRRVVRLAAESGWDVIAPSSGELDIRSRHGVDDLVKSVRPAAVVHLAYRRLERDTIVDGSANVAAAAAAAGCRLVHLSTDVIFAGQPAPYAEHADPSPLEPYGAAKADAETEVAAEHPEAVLVRTSLLLGEPDDLGQSEFDVLRAAGDPSSFSFFADEYRSPARATEVARGVVRLCREPSITGPLHLGGPQVFSRLELAVALADRLGVDAGPLRSTTLVATGLAGKRPGRVELDSGRARTLGLAPGEI